MTWAEHWATLKLVWKVLKRGGTLVERVASAAQGKPEEIPMSAFGAVSKTIGALLKDSTWAQVEAMAKTADKAMNSGDLLVQVVREHGKDVHKDLKLGLEITSVLAPKLAASLAGFLSGPAGGPAIALFSFWLNGLLTGNPVQPKDPAYKLPQGPEGGVNTGA